MIFKRNLIRVYVFNRFNTCRFITSDGSKQSEFAVNNAPSVLQYNDIPKAKRFPLIGTKLDFLLPGFTKRSVL